MMEKEKFTVLIVNDYPLVCEAYKKAFLQVQDCCNCGIFNFVEAHSYDQGVHIVQHYVQTNSKIDLAFLDLKLPSAENSKMISGEDLGIYIRDKLPNCRVVISTTNDNKYIIHSVFRSTNPDGLLIKSDISFNELTQAIQEVIHDPPYYSKTVLKLLRKKVSVEFFLDDVDRKILYELSNGAKVKDMLGYIPLSVAAIEKRKRHLKKMFNVKERGHRELIMKAKESGFI